MRQPKVYSIKRAGSTKIPERTRLEKFTTLLQAASAILVPIIVAVAGLVIQQSIARQTTAKDYVSLAIEILKVEPKKDSVSDPLRDWAVDVLKLDSPIAISEQAQTELRNKRLATYQPPESLTRIATESLRLTSERFAAGTGEFSDVLSAYRQLTKLELESAHTPDERIKVLTTALQRAQELESTLEVGMRLVPCPR